MQKLYEMTSRKLGSHVCQIKQNYE